MHPSVPPELAREFAAGNGTVFVGAELSRTVGFPGWDELLQPLRAELPEKLRTASPLDVAQYYLVQTSRQTLIQRLRDALDSIDPRPGHAHRALLALPDLGRRIYTTNLDDLLERALLQAGTRFRRLVATEDASYLRGDSTWLVKLHGDISRPDSVVVTSEDFERYFDLHRGAARLLDAEFRTRTVLFVGYGHTDPSLRQLLTRVRAETGQNARNLYNLQFAPEALVAADLTRRGLKVIDVEQAVPTRSAVTVAGRGAAPAGAAAPTGDEPGASGRGSPHADALIAWLEAFAADVHAAARTQVAPTSAPTRVVDPSPANNNLPSRDGELLGREDELRQVMGWMHSRYPVVNIEGLAGVGKTRLAAEVGHRCAKPAPGPHEVGSPFDYVVWVSAAKNQEQRRWLSDVLDAIADTAGYPGVSSQSGEGEGLGSKRREVDRLLRRYPILVIIDNFETIDDPDLVTWLERVPEPSKVLITTREGQMGRVGRILHLHGLPTGVAVAFTKWLAHDSGISFIDGVSEATLKSFCAVVGGNPQAIKIALGLMRGGQLSLWAVINQVRECNPDHSVAALLNRLLEKSWDRLREHARCTLSVAPLLAGARSISRSALREAAGLGTHDFDEAIRDCLRFSLLEVDPADADRVTIHPLTRAFARQRLDANPALEARGRERWAVYYTDFVRNHVARPAPAARYWNALVSEGMDAVDPEWDNIEGVLRWTTDGHRDDLFVPLVLLLVHYMDSRFHNAARIAYLERLARVLHAAGDVEGEALVRIDALGWTYVEEDQLDRAEYEIRRGMRLARSLSGGVRDDLIALGYAWRARVAVERDRLDDAQSSIRQALEIPCSPWIETRVHMAAGDIALRSNEPAEARQHYVMARAHAREYGDEGGGYQLLPRMGLAYLGEGHAAAAEEAFTELHRLHRIAIGKLYAEYGLAMVAYARGKRSGALAGVEQIRTRLSERSSSNLLLKLTNRLFDDLKQTRM